MDGNVLEMDGNVVEVVCLKLLCMGIEEGVWGCGLFSLLPGQVWDTG